MRGCCKERTLQSLKDDYEAFVAAGDLKKAKEHNDLWTRYMCLLIFYQHI